MAGGQAGGGCGVAAVRAAARAGALSRKRQRAKLPANYGETPSPPWLPTTWQSPDRRTQSLRASYAHCTSPAKAERPGAPKACP
jgi:hypothetical protein